ncbi:hypothetical protein ANN_25294, partial [Periplaneta americana]
LLQRDLDIRGQLETLTSRLSGKIRNVTCVMQELGYLDENLEPNFEKISERINRLPIGDELKKDMIDGVQFCKQFACRDGGEWWRMVKERNATLDYKTIKRLHANLIRTGSGTQQKGAGRPKTVITEEAKAATTEAFQRSPKKSIRHYQRESGVSYGSVQRLLAMEATLCASSQCVPETRKDRFQLSRELVKPMFFFRCYKHKKLEACIMKDVRERYTPGDDMPGADDDNIGSGELRSLSWTNSKPDNEDMATAVYEFLYGGENAELENIM